MQNTSNENLKKETNFSVKSLVFYKEKILLLQKIDKEKELPWELPGGGVDLGETLAQAALREAKEETGLDIKLLDIVGLWSFSKSVDCFLTGVIFLAQADTDEVQLSHEHCGYVWVKPEELENYTLHNSLRVALKKLKRSDEKTIKLLEYFNDTYKE